MKRPVGLTLKTERLTMIHMTANDLFHHVLVCRSYISAGRSLTIKKTHSFGIRSSGLTRKKGSMFSEKENRYFVFVSLIISFLIFG